MNTNKKLILLGLALQGLSSCDSAPLKRGKDSKGVISNSESNSTNEVQQDPAADSEKDAIQPTSSPTTNIPVLPPINSATVGSAQTLSATRLFKNLATATLRDEFLPFKPNFPLWTDGTEKRRFIFIPAGTKIDVSDPYNWIFPKGSILIKEFSFGGKRVETRIAVKDSDTIGFTAWKFMAYQWSESQTDGIAVPLGASISIGSNPNAQTYKIPGAQQCSDCHQGTKDAVIGFSGVQLNKNKSITSTLFDLDYMEDNHLTTGSVKNTNFDFAVRPGQQGVEDKFALGYIHGNCAHCHNPNFPGRPSFANVGHATSIDQEPFLLSGKIDRINPAMSRFLIRMKTSVSSGSAMPPLGITKSDDVSISRLESWAESLRLEQQLEEKYSLVITNFGSGTIKSNPVGLNCGSQCNFEFSKNAIVNLNASPAGNWSFSGWSGACAGNGPTCSVTMDSFKSVTANFIQSAFTLTISKSGTGTGVVTSSPVGINCGSTCAKVFPKLTVVTLTATPSSGSVFSNWSGACTGKTSSCTVTLDAAKGVRAWFNLPTP